jgi:DNA polymerase-1
MDDSTLDRDAVKKKFDVYPDQIVDYLALVGDTSDNIPGVPKIGAKTAAKWLNLYGSAEGIVEHGEEIKGKVGESLRDNVEQLRLSQSLAAIRRDVDLEVAVDELNATEGDTDALRELYGHYELRSLLRLLDEKADEPAAPAAEKRGDYETVLTWDALDKWLVKIDKAELTAFDTETTSLDYMEAEIVGFSLAVEADRACYVPPKRRKSATT